MTRFLFILTAVLLLPGFAPAQQKAKTPAPAVPAVSPVVVDEVGYPLPLDLRDKFRDLQHENDQIEIENQKMLLKIEQNKARQAVLVDQEMGIASEFGRSKKLDLAQYELDPAPVTLKRKKAK